MNITSSLVVFIKEIAGRLIGGEDESELCGVVYHSKKVSIFFKGEVFFLLIRPLMDDPINFPKISYRTFIVNHFLHQRYILKADKKNFLE